jgi:nucleotide-binding universal stress UspA family protein
MIKKILVPLDGSKFAEKALPYAEALAQKFGAELILIRILLPLAIGSDLGETTLFSPQAFQESETEAKVYLKRVQSELSELRLAPHIQVLEGSSVAEMILRPVCDQEVDVIVMSTHGYSGNRRWVYGSVANKVLQQAPCPVFLVRVTEAEC